jgi:hypothetical protein
MKTLSYEEAKKLVDAYHFVSSQMAVHVNHARHNRMPLTVQAEAVRWANKLFYRLELQIQGKNSSFQFAIKEEDFKDFQQFKDHLPLSLLSLVHQYFSATVYAQTALMSQKLDNSLSPNVTKKR